MKEKELEVNMAKEQLVKFKDAYEKTEMDLSSIKWTNLHMCNDIEELKIINEKFILEIAELKPNEHKSEKITNVTPISKNRENVNNDIQESERNTENSQIEDNQKTNICRNYGIGLECKFGKNCRCRHYREKEEKKDRVCWFFGKPQGHRIGKLCAMPRVPVA